MSRSKAFKLTYESITKIILLGFSFLLVLGALLTPTCPVGESDDYMLTTISLEKRLSQFIIPSDIEQAKIDFPEHAWYWDNYNLVTTKKVGVFHSHYFGSYSFVCIPMKLFLKSFGFSQSYAFALTNAILYILALLLVYFKLKQSNRNIFLTILLLICNPAIFYIWWPSAEIFIFSFVVMSLVFFANHKHKQAAFLISVAGTMQPTILFFGLIIILDYIFYIEFHKIKLSDYKWDKIKDMAIKLLVLSLYFFPVYLLILYNFTIFPFLGFTSGFLMLSGFLGRFSSYLFDLNFGLLPYFSISLALFFILITIGLFRKSRISILYTLGFFGMIALISFWVHINCGMGGIARYNMWIYPIAIIFLITQYEVLINSIRIKKIFVGLLIVSAIISASVVRIYGMFNATNITSYIYMTPIAQIILKQDPVLYRPSPSTFQSRVNHEDGGYQYSRPVIYSSNNGYVKKILVTPATVSMLNDTLCGKSEDLKFLQDKIEMIKTGKGFYYINFDKDRKVVLNNFKKGKQYIKISDPRLQTIVGTRTDDNKLIRASGKSGYFVYGPRISLISGKYILIAKGKLFGNDQSFGFMDIAAKNGTKIFAKKELTETNNQNDSIISTLKFNFAENERDVEFRIYIKNNVSGFFSGYELIQDSIFYN